MDARKHIIWTSEVNVDAWKDDLQAEHPEMDENEIANLAYELNGEYLNDERLNCAGIRFPNGVFIVADLGLWHGRRTGILPEHKVAAIHEVSDCFRSFCDGQSELTIYVDEKGDLRADEAHHDGTNHYIFRAYRPDVSDTQKENLEDLAYTQKDYEKTMKRLTYRLGDLIGDVYGWTFPRRPKCAVR